MKRGGSTTPPLVTTYPLDKNMQRPPLMPTIVLVILFIIGSILVVRLQLFPDPGPRCHCYDDSGDNTYYPSEKYFFTRCIQNDAKAFIDIEYAQTKDLSQSFFTLAVGVFVASITFSEKIVGINNTGSWPRQWMVGCWLTLLLAMVCCGIALTFMHEALWWAVNVPERNYRAHTRTAGWFYIFAGISFVFSLAFMLFASPLTSASPRQEGG